MRVFFVCLCVLISLPVAAASGEPVSETVKAVNAFAAAHQKMLPKGNVLTSPWSIQTSMAMIYAGAAGTTREFMRKAFFFSDDEAALHAGFLALRQAMLAKPAADDSADLRVVSRVYYDQSLSVLPGWKELTRTSYLAEAGLLDFHHGAEAGQQINQWVSEQTSHKIASIIPDHGLDGSTRLVLVNAVYFDLPWDERFTKELTQDQPFHIDASESKPVPLMFKQHRLRYAKKEGFQIAALPYAGGTFQFVVILPDAVDGLAQVEAALTGGVLSECATLSRSEVRLSFPRIRMEPPVVPLRQSLSRMGAQAMFDQTSADFSRMIDKTREEVCIDEVYHRTFLELDENGTKAASATASVMRPKNGVPHEIPHQVVKADHPFLFMIQHVPSGACLFLGRLTDPGTGVKSGGDRGPAKK